MSLFGSSSMLNTSLIARICNLQEHEELGRPLPKVIQSWELTPLPQAPELPQGTHAEVRSKCCTSVVLACVLAGSIRSA